MTARIITGDCREVLATMAANSIDACVTDPPYGLEFMGKEWDKLDYDLPQEQVWKGRRGQGGLNKPDPGPWGRKERINYGGGKGQFKRCTICGKRQFSGSPCKCAEPEWVIEHPDGAPSSVIRMQRWHETWAREVYRVLKPGGHMLAFGGTRTSHRLVCAIEDAGFEIRDCLMYVFGSGFPKSRRVNQDPRFCQCDESAHSDEYSSRERPQDGHIGMAAASLDGAPLPVNAHHSTNTLLDSLGDYLPDSGSGDESARSAEVSVQASLLQSECAPTHSHSAERGDGLDGEPLHSPSLVQYSDLPSNQDFVNLSTFPASKSSDIPASIAASENTPIQTDNGTLDGHTPHTVLQSSASEPPLPNYTSAFPRCLRCGKPNVDGYGTALKPAYEPIVLARKPLSGSVAANVTAWGVGGLNIDGCRIGKDESLRGGRYSESGKGDDGSVYGKGINLPSSSAYEQPTGRWPANLILDAESAALLDELSGERTSGSRQSGEYGMMGFHGNGVKPMPAIDGGSGGASRYFFIAKPDSESRLYYTAKASRAERNKGLAGMPEQQRDLSRRDDHPSMNGGEGNPYNRGVKPVTNHHPTVKPVDLMQWLVRLITPKGGTVLDCFCGSGTTGIAADREGMQFIGIEQDPEYAEIARKRFIGDCPLFAEVVTT